MLTLAIPLAVAQAYPARSITLVVPFPAGGPTDSLARQLAVAMQPSLDGVPIVVENTAGAGGTLGAAKVARATPDGYTLLIWHVGMAASGSLYPKLAFSPLQDFEYLGLINDVPMALLGTSRLPAANYGEMLDHIRRHRGRLHLAHAGLGSASHLCGLMWMSAAGLKEKLSPVPYRGTGPAMSDLIGGQVDVMCDQTTNASEQIRAQRIKAFAVTTERPLLDLEIFSGFPTLDQVGLNGFNLTIWHGLYAPGGTPSEIRQKVNDALRQALKDPIFQASQAALGAKVVQDHRLSPEGHKAFVAQETEKFRLAIEATGTFSD
ncbi:tripartite tricarboxylate transporter substrate binding protein BugD [Hydrogenophaga sp. 5NK40-0174]